MARPDIYEKAANDPGSLTEDEKLYLQDRDRLPEGVKPMTQEERGAETEIVATAVGSSVVPKDQVKQFTDPESANDGEDVVEIDSYDALSPDELKGELKARNLSTSGKKEDLVARLEADDSKAAKS